MSLFVASELRLKAQAEQNQRRKTTATLLGESRNQKISDFDVFLCHSRMDEELILGTKTSLEEYGLRVYVDWINDPQLDRTKVSFATANQLRTRMSCARMLVYAHTENSSNSKWCPWELGFFDGMRGGNVFHLPIVETKYSHFAGQEYLDLYPYLDKVASLIFMNEVQGGLMPLREALTKTYRKSL